MSSLQCCICRESTDEGNGWRVLSSCGHVLHTLCLQQHLAYRQTCPTCRASIVQEPSTRDAAAIAKNLPLRVYPDLANLTADSQPQYVAVFDGAGASIEAAQLKQELDVATEELAAAKQSCLREVTKRRDQQKQNERLKADLQAAQWQLDDANKKLKQADRTVAKLRQDLAAVKREREVMHGQLELHKLVHDTELTPGEVADLANQAIDRHYTALARRTGKAQQVPKTLRHLAESLRVRTEAHLRLSRDATLLQCQLQDERQRHVTAQAAIAQLQDEVRAAQQAAQQAERVQQRQAQAACMHSGDQFARPGAAACQLPEVHGLAAARPAEQLPCGAGTGWHASLDSGEAAAGGSGRPQLQGSDVAAHQAFHDEEDAILLDVLGEVSEEDAQPGVAPEREQVRNQRYGASSSGRAGCGRPAEKENNHLQSRPNMLTQSTEASFIGGRAPCSTGGTFIRTGADGRGGRVNVLSTSALGSQRVASLGASGVLRKHDTMAAAGKKRKAANPVQTGNSSGLTIRHFFGP